MIYLLVLMLLICAAILARFNIWRKSVSYDFARVLMYHSISDHFGEKHDKWRVKPSSFERQIKWLYQNGFKSYFVSELIALNPLPPKSVAITFDDGFKDNIKAVKILQKYGFKATIYIVAGAKENSWDSEHSAHLSPMLNENEIKELQTSGSVEFGSHTTSHANLCTLSQNELKSELKNSKIAIEKLTGAPCESFAYPYGKFCANIINELKNAGYKNGVIVKRGVFDKQVDPYQIPRIGILGTESFFDFWLRFTRIRNKL